MHSPTEMSIEIIEEMSTEKTQLLEEDLPSAAIKASQENVFSASETIEDNSEVKTINYPVYSVQID